MGFPRYFWHFFLVPGILLLIGAVFDGYRTWDAQRLIAHAQGTVVRTAVTGKLGLDFSAEIQFSTPDGKSHTFSSVMDSVNALRTGRTVTVVYDIDDPDHGRVEMGSPHPWEGVILLSVWGGIFALLGGIPLYFRARKAKQADWLKLNGQLVRADFRGIHKNTNVSVNDRNPFRIKAQWTDPSTNKIQEFWSDNLWTDPTGHAPPDTITVMIDPANAKRYWMDLSFLPDSHGHSKFPRS